MKYALTTMLTFVASAVQAHEIALPHSHEAINPLVTAAVTTAVSLVLLVAAFRHRNST